LNWSDNVPLLGGDQRNSGLRSVLAQIKVRKHAPNVNPSMLKSVNLDERR
jgi:hypothetical protein